MLRPLLDEHDLEFNDIPPVKNLIVSIFFVLIIYYSIV